MHQENTIDDVSRYVTCSTAILRICAGTVLECISVMGKHALSSATAHCFEQSFDVADPESALLLRSDSLACKAFDNALVDLSFAPSG